MPDERKPVPVGSGEKTTLAAPASNSLDAMIRRGVTVEGIEASAPEFHRRALRQIGVRSAESAMERLEASTGYKSATDKTKKSLERGDVAMDTEKKMQVVVLKAAAARGHKSGKVYHRVIHRKTGDEWLQRADRLEFIK